jgi:hypothetical protein
MTFTMACGIVNGVRSAIGGSKTTSELWADVPAFDGAKKADIDLPLPVQLMFKGMLAAGNQESSDTKLNDVEAAIYSTDKSPAEVTQFYTQELMKSNGWTLPDQPGCDNATLADAQQIQALSGSICIFGKQGSNKDKKEFTALFIMVQREESAKDTVIYYGRVEGAEK